MISKNPSKLQTMTGQKKVDSALVLTYLGEMFPQAQCELVHATPFQLLIAVMLSAQTTDQSVNKVTPLLFQHFPTPYDLANASSEHVEEVIKTIGLYRSKAKHIIETSRLIVDRHLGQVPNDRVSLEALPGVGRKTANVVLSVAFHIPAIAVDTHVERVSKRLGLVTEKSSVREVETKLMKLFPETSWHQLHHQLIFLGRYQCKARAPQCATCRLNKLCRYYQNELLKK